MRAQAYLGDTASSVPDHRNEANIAIQRVIIFLLEEGLNFSLLKKNTTPVKCNKAKHNKTRYACVLEIFERAQPSKK